MALPVEDADRHVSLERAPRIGGKQGRKRRAIVGGDGHRQARGGGQRSQVVEPAGLECGEPIVGLHARANQALVETGHAGARYLVGDCGDTDNGDKDEQEQKGDDDLLPERSPPCRVAS